ncbi:MAG TPA: putative sulfate exporter family transporter, partial [Roseiarcus sp.]|nr:putative sulfate exporter family transporter [Roseiarcus sp.]
MDAQAALTPRLGPLPAFAPGLALTAGIAALAFALRLIPGVSVLSPMILSVLIGVVVHNFVGAPHAARKGMAFSLRAILRFAIMLLGLQITARQAAELGGGGLAMIAAALASTLAFTLLMGRALGVARGLALLIGVGTSICGASAVIAAKAATGGKDDDAAYAVACVTLFGSLAMFAYPLAQGFLHLTPRAYGLWAGASIHEIAQAVAASFQAGGEAGQFGTIAKLTRVAMMAPVVIALGEMTARLGL